MKECKRFEKLLVAYLHGELYERDYHALRVHLDQCPACRAELMARHEALQLLGEALAAAPAPAVLPYWRPARQRAVNLRGSLAARIWYSAQFRAALATSVIAVFAFMFSGMFVVFSVVQKEEQCFTPPTPMARPQMKLKKPSVSVKKSGPPSESRLYGAALYEEPAADEALAAGGGMAGEELSYSYFGFAGSGDYSGLGGAGADPTFSAPTVDRPRVAMKKLQVPASISKSAPPKPSRRIVAKGAGISIPEIAMPEMSGIAGGMDSYGLADGSSVGFSMPEIAFFGAKGGAADQPSAQPQVPADGFAALDSIADSINGRQSAVVAGQTQPAGSTQTVWDFDDPVASGRGVAELGLHGGSGDGALKLDLQNATPAWSADALPSSAPVAQRLALGNDLGKAAAPALGDRAGGAKVEGDFTVGDLFGSPVMAEEPKPAPAPAAPAQPLLKPKAKPVDRKLSEKREAADKELEALGRVRERKPAAFNPYVEAAGNPFSTFSIDVDTASYGLARQQLLGGNLPAPESVRTEEFINSFEYDYRPPAGAQTFAVHAAMAPSPFRPPMELLKIGIKGRRIGRDDHRGAVLTLVVDTSGSMSTPDRLGLVKASLALLLDQLGPDDRVAIVQFGGDARLVREHLPASGKAALREAIDALQPGGPTQFDKGLELGYQVASAGYGPGDSNRIIVLSDGVANLGELDPEAMLAQVAEYRAKGIYLSVLGFGQGTYDDELLEQLANRGDGSYAFVDTLDEARRLFVDQLAATLHVIASDVKIQVEFNPERVVRYRQLGYENRRLTKEQFRDDTVDAGEVGSGQSVTALYEVELKPGEADGEPVATVHVRYRRSDNGTVEETSRGIGDAQRSGRFEEADPRFRLAACAAEFAEKLRRNPYADGTSLDEVFENLQPVALALDLDGQVGELQQLISTAAALER